MDRARRSSFEKVCSCDTGIKEILLGVNWNIVRLWHQLTQKLLILVHRDNFQEGGLIDVSINHLI